MSGGFGLSLRLAEITRIVSHAISLFDSGMMYVFSHHEMSFPDLVKFLIRILDLHLEIWCGTYLKYSKLLMSYVIASVSPFSTAA